MSKSREEWRRLVTRAVRSGLGSRTTSAPREAHGSALDGIVEVRASGAGDDRFELELIGGRRLRLPARFDEAALRRLLAVLEGPS